MDSAISLMPPSTGFNSNILLSDRTKPYLNLDEVVNYYPTTLKFEMDSSN